MYCRQHTYFHIIAFYIKHFIYRADNTKMYFMHITKRRIEEEKKLPSISKPMNLEILSTKPDSSSYNLFQKKKNFKQTNDIFEHTNVPIHQLIKSISTTNNWISSSDSETYITRNFPLSFEYV